MSATPDIKQAARHVSPLELQGDPLDFGGFDPCEYGDVVWMHSVAIEQAVAQVEGSA